MIKAIAVISLGGAVGCVARWGLSTRFNGMFSVIPAGTLVANWLGGYLIGLATAYLATHPMIAPEWRLFIVTGFLGGLTTFSTFAAEVVSLLQSGRLMWAIGAIGLHVGGALLMTILGISTVMLTR